MNYVIRLLRQPVNAVDSLLNRVTSYRLVLYILLAEFGLGIILAAAGKLPFSAINLIISGAFLVGVSYLVNLVLAHLLNIPKNRESDLITGLILALILAPAASGNDYLILGVAAAAAQLSKYILVWGRRHILNPAAVGAVVAGLAFSDYASWWVGTAALTPLVAVGSLLIWRKMNRFMMALAFLAAYLAVLAITTASSHSLSQAGHDIWLAVSASSLLFFAGVMLTEPQTSPAKKPAYFSYAVLTAVLYGVTKLHLAPGEALLVGNTLGYLLEPSKRLKLSFIEKIKEAEGIYSYVFNSTEDFRFQPGQYMEWTLPVHESDSRGNRRYLTLATAPEERDVAFTIKLPEENASRFKQHLNQLAKGDPILASHPAGSFTLPDDGSQPVLIAGGIGVTPFRSMVAHQILRGHKRQLTLIYAASHPNEFAFKELWQRAKSFGVRTVHVVTSDNPPSYWGGRKGRLDAALFSEVVQDNSNHKYYISGPYEFVKTTRNELLKAGVSTRRIITDYFPGYP